MKEMTVKEMYTLEETIAKDLFEGVTYPWEVLPKISSFILELGASLPEGWLERPAWCPRNHRGTAPSPGSPRGGSARQWRLPPSSVDSATRTDLETPVGYVSAPAARRSGRANAEAATPVVADRPRC